MQSPMLPFWKEVPVVRLLLATIVGILLQYYLNFSVSFIFFSLFSFVFAFIIFRFGKGDIRFRYGWMRGIALQMIVLCAAMVLTWQRDFRNWNSWYGNFYHKGDALVITLTGPTEQKPKTLKAEGKVLYVISKDKQIKTIGKIVMYFSPSDVTDSLLYGSTIITKVPPLPIYDNGNPGGFDYKRFSAFQQIYHTAFLKEGSYALLKDDNSNFLYRFIYKARDRILEWLQKYIPDQNNSLGIAEALLIGYKQDLDKDLTQAYSNTGVVHIIAISGMHLGLIFLMLEWIIGKIPIVNRSRIFKAVFILSFLWIFSLLTGASASVMRSAVMFTFIVFGKYFFNQNNTYNSLAASAFLMLLYNPYWLWDVGFQLSYAAVLGIVWLQRPIYKWFYFSFKPLRWAWATISVTLAAQVFTLPLTIFYFHQFPVLFPLSNFIAVPVSSLILYIEIALLLFGWIPGVGWLLGKIIYILITFMNNFIKWIDSISFSRIDNIPADTISTIILFFIIIFLAWWLMHNKEKNGLVGAAISLVAFIGYYSFLFWKRNHQERIIVYNAGKNFSMDFISKQQYINIADSTMMNSLSLQNFYCRSSRIYFMATYPVKALPEFDNHDNFYSLHGKVVFIADSNFIHQKSTNKMKTDAVIISGNPKLSVHGILEYVDTQTIVIAANNSLWKTAAWKKECSALALRCHLIARTGAFVLNAD